jgi:hypothetical protein
MIESGKLDPTPLMTRYDWCDIGQAYSDLDSRISGLSAVLDW